MRATISMVFFISVGSTLNAETIRCTKTEDAKEVFSMNTENLQAEVFRAGTSMKMSCRDDGNKSWRCFAQSESDPLHWFEVIISKSPRFIEYYGRDFWAYPLTCNGAMEARGSIFSHGS